MKLVTLVETTLGLLEVETQPVPWIWTILTLGLFRKVVCRIYGPALKRHYEIRMEVARRFKTTPPTWDKDYLEETLVFHTIFCRVAFWHEQTVPYAQSIGRILDRHHYALQRLRQFFDALQEGDPEKALQLLKEESICRRKEVERLHNIKPF